MSYCHFLLATVSVCFIVVSWSNLSLDQGLKLFFNNHTKELGGENNVLLFWRTGGNAYKPENESNGRNTTTNPPFAAFLKPQNHPDGDFRDGTAKTFAGQLIKTPQLSVWTCESRTFLR